MREEQREQRRGYFRIPIEIPFLWTVADRNLPWRSAVSRDLSAGGLSFVGGVDDDLQPGKRMTLRLALGNEVLELQGEVVRLLPLSSADPESDQERMIGVRFVDMSPRREERLVRFIFQVESARRRLSRSHLPWGNEA